LTRKETDLGDKMPHSMNTLQLSPTVLDWAAKQVGQTLYEFAQKISKRNVDKIIEGILTDTQVLKVAKTSGVSLGDLFLDAPPPPRQLPVADFRTVQYAAPLGRDFFETFDDIEFKQSWYRDTQILQGQEPLSFVGKFKKDRPTATNAAVDIRAALKFSDVDVASLRNPDELFSLLASRCEDNGILVFKNGVVGQNTHRPLDVAEFRGFAIADNLAPVIFINGADAPAAWVFTLAHELAHIWLGDSGVSDAAPNAENATERYCNAVAAEFLVPAKSFMNLWQSSQHLSLDEILGLAKRSFKVSGLVIARRALDLNLIDIAAYRKIYEQARQKKKGNSSGGGDFYRTLAVRNSKKFTLEVAGMAISGSITLGQAGRLLNTNPNNVVKYYAKQNSISV
jgi:Zn-dependent peptidase ImmA (M78 family)